MIGTPITTGVIRAIITITIGTETKQLSLVGVPMQQDAARYRENAEFCLAAARLATAPGLADAFERLARTWLKMADELECPPNSTAPQLGNRKGPQP